MARKRYEIKSQAEMELNMTSMIDIVFLLIIFFITVTDLSKLDSIAAVQLPVADQAYIDPTVAPDKIVLNIKKGDDDKPMIYFKNKPVNREELRDLLHIAALRKPEGPPVNPGEPAPSKQQIMIRADRHLQFQFVQEVMMDCAEQGLYKVSLIAMPVERE